MALSLFLLLVVMPPETVEVLVSNVAIVADVLVAPLPSCPV